MSFFFLSGPPRPGHPRGELLRGPRHRRGQPRPDRALPVDITNVPPLHGEHQDHHHGRLHVSQRHHDKNIVQLVPIHYNFYIHPHGK